MEKQIVEINGKKYEMSLTPVDEQEADIFDIRIGDIFYYRGINNTVRKETSLGMLDGACLKGSGNMCKDKDYIEINCSETELYDRLRKYSYQHQKEMAESERYYIGYDKNHKYFDVFWNKNNSYPGVVYFSRRETAEDAIEKIVKPFCNEHPEYLGHLKGDKV